VLRELEGFSYKEIAGVVGIPMGTVMSTLSRARERFRHRLSDLVNRQPRRQDRRAHASPPLSSQIHVPRAPMTDGWNKGGLSRI